MDNQDTEDLYYKDPKNIYVKNDQNNLVYRYSSNSNSNGNKEVPYNTVSQNYYNQNKNYFEKGKITSSPSKSKLRYAKVIIPIIVIITVIVSVAIVLFGFENGHKKRTFMIYMVGSDLESKSKQGTFSLADIVGENIDLKNNNVVLMVGGAKKWHNFVDPDEIGIYELTSGGFDKKDALPIESMGASNTLETFLDYSYKHYKSDKYDMIFWNHGLGAIGIEQDELSKDFLTISELNTAFKNSAFNDDKLELTIFYNCLASNLHLANIMKNYSEYMVASEEIFYLSKVLNRLNFLEKVEPSDEAYEIGQLFIEQSDKVVNEYNKTHTKKIDSTLSIIDLSKIDNLNSSLNSFVKSIDVDSNYYEISNYRRKTHTYGISQTYDYDTIDLYTLVESLGKIINENDSSKKVLSSIKDVVKYTSNMNDYSNGISIYFPYFGSEASIETHLSLFSKVFNDAYYSFINEFYQIRSGAKKAKRSASNNSYNKLTNNIFRNTDGSLAINLTPEEVKNYQGANIYLFKKLNEDEYELILQSDNLTLSNNTLVFKNNNMLMVNNTSISYIKNDKYTTYGKLYDKSDELNVKFTVENNKIVETILDSDQYISSSIIDYNDYSSISFMKLKYKLLENGLFNEYFKDSVTKEEVKINSNKVVLSVNNQVGEYYALIEMNDMYNDSYYSNIEVVYQ